MPQTLQFKRGNKTNLPATAPSGMPLWCEDTKELYIGTGSGVEKICTQSSLPGTGGGELSQLTNSLTKAVGWTNHNTCRCLFAHINTNKIADLAGPANFTTLVRNFATNYSGGFCVHLLDGKLYFRNTTTNAYTQMGTFTDWIAYSVTGSQGYAIRQDRSLYYISASSYGNPTITLVDNTASWTKLASYYYNPTFGIRAGVLCKINSSRNVTVVDNTGTWTEVIGLSYGLSGYGIKDGKLYYIETDGTLTQMGTDTGWTSITGSSSGLGIRNGALYHFERNSTLKLVNDTETWVKTCGATNAMTASGKLYYYYQWGSNALTQIGTSTDWTDICGSYYSVGLALNNGNVYRNLNPSNITQVTFDGGYTQIDGEIQPASSSLVDEVGRTCAVMISNTNPIPNIYTVASPNAESKSYFNTNLTEARRKIHSIDSSTILVEPQIDGNYPSYSRNSAIDSTFASVPEENQRTMDLITNLGGN